MLMLANQTSAIGMIVHQLPIHKHSQPDAPLPKPGCSVGQKLNHHVIHKPQILDLRCPDVKQSSFTQELSFETATELNLQLYGCSSAEIQLSGFSVTDNCFI